MILRPPPILLQRPVRKEIPNTIQRPRQGHILRASLATPRDLWETSAQAPLLCSRFPMLRADIAPVEISSPRSWSTSLVQLSGLIPNRTPSRDLFEVSILLFIKQLCGGASPLRQLGNRWRLAADDELFAHKQRRASLLPVFQATKQTHFSRAPDSVLGQNLRDRVNHSFVSNP